MKSIELITDGSCIGNPGPGGWAALIRTSEGEKLLTGGDSDTTNNRMEMLAVIEGMKAIAASEPCKIKIVSDSKYVIDAFEKKWIQGWIAKDWRNAAKKPVKNKDLWLEMIALLSPHQIQWEWVKGHNGHTDNEIVDTAAQKAAQTFR